MPLRLATFNTRDFFDDEPPGLIGSLSDEGLTVNRRQRARKLFREKVTGIADQLIDLDADVLCLQEVKGGRVLESLDAALDGRIENYPHQALGPACDPRGIRVAVMSRFPIETALCHGEAGVGMDGIALPRPQSEGDFDGGVLPKRGALEVDLAIPRIGALKVINVHLKSHALSHTTPPVTQLDWGRSLVRGEIHRLAEALWLRRLLDVRQQAHPDGFLVLAGDFNDEIESCVMKVIRGRSATRHSLTDGVMTSVMSEVPPERRHSLLYRGRPMLFDHVLAGSRLWERRGNVRILNEDLEDRMRRIASRGRLAPDSDHAPVLAEFEI